MAHHLDDIMIHDCTYVYVAQPLEDGHMRQRTLAGDEEQCYMYDTGVENIYATEPVYAHLQRKRLKVCNFEQPLRFIDLRDRKKPRLFQTRAKRLLTEPPMEMSSTTLVLQSVAEFHDLIRCDVMGYSLFVSAVIGFFS